LYLLYKELYEKEVIKNELLLKQVNDKRIRKKKSNFDYNQYTHKKANGDSDLNIADDLGISLRTLYRYLEDRRVKPNLSTNFDYQDYLDKKANHIPDYKIAKDLNISPSTLSRLLKKYK
jgi:transcriptional regulator with XRE-family HTH domain